MTYSVTVRYTDVRTCCETWAELERSELAEAREELRRAGSVRYGVPTLPGRDGLVVLCRTEDEVREAQRQARGA